MKTLRFSLALVVALFFLGCETEGPTTCTTASCFGTLDTSSGHDVSPGIDNGVEGSNGSDADSSSADADAGGTDTSQPDSKSDSDTTTDPCAPYRECIEQEVWHCPELYGEGDSIDAKAKVVQGKCALVSKVFTMYIEDLQFTCSGLTYTDSGGKPFKCLPMSK